MSRALSLFALLLALGPGCDDKSAADSGAPADDTAVAVDDTGADDTATDDTGEPNNDGDGDGFDDVAAGGDDCDDNDDGVYPGADEYCDGEDNDCDSAIDEGALDASTWYTDGDGDGYGDDGATEQSCGDVAGASLQGGDCDDGDAFAHPGAAELCDGEDNDCDSAIDEGAEVLTWYLDQDEDGYGNADISTEDCDTPKGDWALTPGDCADTDASAYPGAPEDCDGDDDDCDGAIDEGASGGDTWYADDDGDGYGDASDTTTACEQPAGHTDDASDCDDGDSAVHPGADEYCNDIDDDCDGDVDPDDSVDAETWYADDDGDGYGDADVSEVSCDAPSGYVADRTDCDDTDDSVTDDTCEGDSWDGTYTGTLEIDVTVTALGLSDTCSGEIEIEVDETASDPIDGAGSCAFGGLLASYLPGDQAGTITGEITSDPDAEGDIAIESIISTGWSGGFVDPDALEGSFGGKATYSGFAITYSGEFEAER